jgi:Tol biopolymer transport system component
MADGPLESAVRLARRACSGQAGHAHSMASQSAISPDGSRVAYRRTQAGSVQVWIAPLSGEPPVPLWEDPERVFQRGTAWSPDGNWIAFYSTRDGKNAVLKARVGASKRPDLVAYTGSAQPVRWSPRGDWIAFQDSSGLRVASPDGKLDRVLNCPEPAAMAYVRMVQRWSRALRHRVS